MGLLLAANSHAGSNESSGARAEVMSAFHGLGDSVRRLDLESYFGYFDQERFTGINADGQVWHSFADFKHTVEPGFEAIDKVIRLDFSDVMVTMLDKRTAILVNRFEQVIRLNDGQEVEVSGAGIQVWSKRSGCWRLVSVSAS